MPLTQPTPSGEGYKNSIHQTKTALSASNKNCNIANNNPIKSMIFTGSPENKSEINQEK